MLSIHFSKSSHCYKGYLLRLHFVWRARGWGLFGKLLSLNITLVLAMYWGASWQIIEWNSLMYRWKVPFLTAPCSLYKYPLGGISPEQGFLVILSPASSGLNLCLPLASAGRDIMTQVNLCPGFISILCLLSWFVHLFILSFGVACIL